MKHRIIHIQPALPKYRVNFFQRLSSKYGNMIQVYYSNDKLLNALSEEKKYDWAKLLGPIRSCLGVSWQSGAIFVGVEKGDFLVLSGNPRQISTLLLLIKGKIVGAKVIWWGHHWSSTSRSWRQKLRYLPMSLCDAVLFYTDYEVEDYLANNRSIRKKVPVVALNNGIDIDPIEQVREEYSASQRGRSMLFIGRLTKKARLELLLESMVKLSDSSPTLYVIGSGAEQDRLESLAKKVGVQDKVVWCGAIIEEDRIAAIANRCSVFIYPGEVGLSLIHGMAYRLPSIVHNNPRFHMPEIGAFKNGSTGIEFKYDDATSLAEAINKLFSDSQMLNDLSQGAGQVVGASFCTSDMAKRFISLIDGMEKAG